MSVKARTCFLCGTAHFTTQPCPAKKSAAPELPIGVTKGLPVVKRAAVSDLVAAKRAQPVIGLATDGGMVAVETLEGWRARALVAEAALEARRTADRVRTDRRRKKVGA